MTAKKPAATSPATQAQAAYDAARARVNAADLPCKTHNAHKLVQLGQAIDALQNAATERRFSQPLQALQDAFNDKTPGKDGKARTEIKRAMHQVARAHELHRHGAWSVDARLKTPLRVLQKEYSQCAHKVLRHAETAPNPAAEDATTPDVRTSYIRNLAPALKIRA